MLMGSAGSATHIKANQAGKTAFLRCAVPCFAPKSDYLFL